MSDTVDFPRDNRHYPAMLNVRLPVQVRERLKAAADADGRDLSNLSRLILSQWVEKQDAAKSGRNGRNGRSK